MRVVYKNGCYVVIGVIHAATPFQNDLLLSADAVYCKMHERCISHRVRSLANGFGAGHTGSAGFTSDCNAFTVLCKFVIVMTNILANWQLGQWRSVGHRVY